MGQSTGDRRSQRGPQQRASQGKVSGHLKCLKECGLVIDRPEGREVHDRIASDEVLGFVRSAERLLTRTGQHIELCSNSVGPAEIETR